ncbi:Peptidyl-prolyl cis-trans isomerase cyp18 [Posidoniimonas polymericola]|uniref:Peptidyl-prolyl cis-trans isomerase cyp18 n=1 Tax=Posidoniimonas polymericola TaxID=2528002 RepID=A0A5C5XWE7_9BACT|nr:peptidylprolyl isomerase [Posidoniimonas polymericola]TWT67667.1 Peptidyl-prolyl cis-trans isomerase cyp18 [Posidoniimonas polymericola]
MLRPYSPAAALIATLVIGLAPSIGSAQTVRFLTSVGDFYLELNPTNDANLQGHVDNLLAYIGTGRYHGSVVNRAPEGFVLQLGGFEQGNFTPETLPPGGFDGIEKFDSVTVDANDDGIVDFDTLPNTTGTVSLALAGGQPNSGTSSFFVNLTDNSDLLDVQGFAPFATVTDMADIDRIMALEQVDLSAQIGQSGNLAYIDVPLTPDGDFVILESVMVIDDPFVDFAGPIRSVSSVVVDGAELLSSASSAATSSNALLNAASSSSSSSLLSATSAPEPTAALLGLLAAAGVTLRRRR